jgi:hypothetical protein
MLHVDDRHWAGRLVFWASRAGRGTRAKGGVQRGGSTGTSRSRRIGARGAPPRPGGRWGGRPPGVLPGDEADGVGGDPEAVGRDPNLQADDRPVVVPPGAGAPGPSQPGAQGKLAVVRPGQVDVRAQDGGIAPAETDDMLRAVQPRQDAVTGGGIPGVYAVGQAHHPVDPRAPPRLPPRSPPLVRALDLAAEIRKPWCATTAFRARLLGPGGGGAQRPRPPKQRQDPQRHHPDPPPSPAHPSPPRLRPVGADDERPDGLRLRRVDRLREDLL